LPLTLVAGIVVLTGGVSFFPNSRLINPRRFSGSGVGCGMAVGAAVVFVLVRSPKIRSPNFHSRSASAFFGGSGMVLFTGGSSGSDSRGLARGRAESLLLAGVLGLAAGRLVLAFVGAVGSGKRSTSVKVSPVLVFFTSEW
jgi:hypothetical protein